MCAGSSDPLTSQTIQSSHSLIQFTFLARFLFIVSLALNIAGYTMLIDPQSTTLPTGRATSLILAGSLISFIVVTLNFFFFVIASCACALDPPS